MGLDMDIRYLKGVGEVRARAFSKLGVRTVYDLIGFFPRSYEDRTVIKPISKITPGESVCVRAVVETQPRLTHLRKGLDYVKFRAVDDTGALVVTFFNQGYLKDAFRPGETYVFYGKVSGFPGRPEMVSPVFEKEGARSLTGRIVPLYRLTAGLKQSAVAAAVRQALETFGDQVPEVIPGFIREKYNLAHARYAYENIHFPADFSALAIARRRLVFEELLTLSAAMSLIRRGRGEKTGRALMAADIGEFYKALPFEPTAAQRRAIAQAVSDMASGAPMNRLVQGDVGSGKTAVAAACCWYAAKSGCQSAFMAPTEILAEQHYRTLSGILEPLDVRVGLLTGSMTPAAKRRVRGQIRLGEIQVVVGTHALLSEGVEFFDLALVVTDEQHRFGVAQRAALAAKGESPHVLVMSATPIPRTLALIIYGDLDVSIIDELPPGRQPVETYAVGERHRQRIYAFMRRLISEGRQAYVVCPMVEEGETADEDLKSAEAHAEKLRREVFPDLRIGLLHGRMKPKEKEAVMASFKSGEIDILVATTVVEVGVDVPNAAVMVVENADRFGLSQLHQLRGRVGRGGHKSYCILFEGSGGEASRARLKVLSETCDGFKIAEEDLRLRGPGDFFGSRQHGLPEMRIADLAADMDVLEKAQAAARELISADPRLERPECRALREKIARMFESYSNALN